MNVDPLPVTIRENGVSASPEILKRPVASGATEATSAALPTLKSDPEPEKLLSLRTPADPWNVKRPVDSSSTVTDSAAPLTANREPSPAKVLAKDSSRESLMVAEPSATADLTNAFLSPPEALNRTVLSL